MGCTPSNESLLTTMKRMWKSYGIVIIFSIGLFACNQNKIEVTEGRLELPEPDKPLRIDSETRQTLMLIDDQISSSDKISSCKSGKKLVNSGVEILPYLKDYFSDTTETNVFSENNKRTLKLGEIAIIVASKIKPIPIARVVGIQQCTPPFEMEIENYLWKIEMNPKEFIEKYNDWIKEGL